MLRSQEQGGWLKSCWCLLLSFCRQTVQRLRQDGKQNCCRHGRPGHLPCFTAAAFLGAVPPTGIIIKTKDWQSLFRLHTCCSLNRFASGRRSLWECLLWKKWQMFWKHLIQIKQTEKDFVCALCCDVTLCFFFFFFYSFLVNYIFFISIECFLFCFNFLILHIFSSSLSILGWKFYLFIYLFVVTWWHSCSCHCFWSLKRMLIGPVKLWPAQNYLDRIYYIY